MITRMNGALSMLVSKKGLEPSYPILPATSEKGESSVPGVFLVGEVAGVPLIKLGLNGGHEIIDQLAIDVEKERSSRPDAEMVDFLIVGAGAAGLGAAARAKERGFSSIVVDANHVAETVYTMTKGKILFAEPDAVENLSSMWFEECTKEALLAKWKKQIAEKELDVREFEKVLDIQRQGKSLRVQTEKNEYTARRVILAVGKAGNPRKAGVPGEIEFATRIEHRLLDPDVFNNRNILIYGGGDVALEGALRLCETNAVTLVTIDKEFIYPKKRNVDALLQQASRNKIKIHMDSHLVAIEESSVKIAKGSPTGPAQSLKNDQVFEMIGAEIPTPFFKKIGIKLDNEWDMKRWVYLAVVFLFVYSLYSLKSYGKGVSAWPFNHLITEGSYDAGIQFIFKACFAPFSWMFSENAYQDLLAERGYQQGYIYSLLYSVAMLVFGFEAMIRWRGVSRNKGYQTYRYLTLIGFQVVFFLVVNLFAIQAMSVNHAWRAWGLYQPFPLFFNTFFWWSDHDPRWIMGFFIGAGLLGSLVAIPILSRNHGKRFCTWVCGCGGLAETLGDRWRHLAAKGSRSRSWEFQGVVVLAASVIVGLVVVGLYETQGNNIWWQAYNYTVDFWLVAVIPIALYPFFGGKVWCRYWCPLAAYNGLLARWYGRLKIVSNSKCISCTQCSKYCQVGIDVMAFAKNQQHFDNANSSCIQCGICIDVCPMDVLSFTTDRTSVS